MYKANEGVVVVVVVLWIVKEHVTNNVCYKWECDVFNAFPVLCQSVYENPALASILKLSKPS